jgi:hypothetical protein
MKVYLMVKINISYSVEILILCIKNLFLYKMNSYNLTPI